MPKSGLIVIDIAGTLAKVISLDGESEAILGDIGFVRSGDRFERSISGLGDLEILVMQLISIGALFTFGHDWSPAAVAEYLQEQGKEIVGCRTIEWANPHTYIISKVNA